MPDPGGFLTGIFDATALLSLLAGVVAGLILGVIPGVGGLFGLVVLVPFTYHLDPFAAVALLLGVTAVTTISDTIPAVLLGVPGTISAIATVEDGHPLARQGQAARALGAAFSSSMLGGIFGAMVLFATIPFMRPIVTTMQTPDFLAISIMGMLLVSLISGRDSLKGLASLLIGILLCFVGLDSNTGEERFTAGMIYFWDGVPLEVLFLGLFGFPEMIDLLRRPRISDHAPKAGAVAGLKAGIADMRRNWRLVLQSSGLGAVLGAIPGVGVTVIDWVAYGLAKRANREAPEFGEGNIKGVIAPESANNAKEGGYLIPTIALGLPGSVTMTILLAAFNVQGISPGPQMLQENLPLIYAMVFYICVANIIGTMLCLSFTGAFARIAVIPTHYIFAVATVFLVLGVFSRNGDPKDFAVFVAAGFLGYLMKHNGWSRAALSLGFVLGASVERFFHLSIQMHGVNTFLRPLVLIALALLLIVIMASIRSLRRTRGDRVLADDGAGDALSYVALTGLGVVIVSRAADLTFVAGLFPIVIGTATILLGLALLVRFLWRRRSKGVKASEPSRMEGLAAAAAPARMALYSLAFLLLIYAIGHLAATFVFVLGVVVFHTSGGRLPAALTAAGCTAVVYGVFDTLVSVRWPHSLVEIVVARLA
ncbi:tripartite tricarboxylate transporter permease [Oricola sp.]|uniref:tripartite tricarboxylate transporter permease n=1 Tax=Oricola sp. TaxID=1979950 RepID=UPI0025F1B231|nr:tripartite tricarboxylate transporter permease [Oricola sp.]MCI5077427.1 tripartite tricarboxylate transporter permease [Oricola sp.]